MAEFIHMAIASCARLGKVVFISSGCMIKVKGSMAKKIGEQIGNT